MFLAMLVHSAVAFLAAILGAASASTSNYPGVGFGSTWGVWPKPPKEGGPTIMRMTTTLVVPEIPHPAKEVLILWPGINTAGGTRGKGLVQTITASWKNPQNIANCQSVKPGEWLAQCSAFEVSTGKQEIGKCVGVKKGDKMAMTYKYDKKKDTYHQTLLVNGKKASTWASNGFGPGHEFYIETECQHQWRGNSPTHHYSNTTITLDKAHKDYGSHLQKHGATDSGFKSTDGGKTWHVDKITIKGAPCNPSGK